MPIEGVLWSQGASPILFFLFCESLWICSKGSYKQKVTRWEYIYLQKTKESLSIESLLCSQAHSWILTGIIWRKESKLKDHCISMCYTSIHYFLFCCILLCTSRITTVPLTNEILRFTLLTSTIIGCHGPCCIVNVDLFVQAAREWSAHHRISWCLQGISMVPVYWLAKGLTSVMVVWQYNRLSFSASNNLK